MDGTESSAGHPGPAERSHRSSVSSVGARAADVLVYLADDTVVPLAVENLPSLSAHELHRAVREVLRLPDIALDAFALWLVSPLLEKLDSFLPAHLCKRGQGLFAAFRGRGAKAGPGEQGLLNAYRQVKEAVGSDGGCEATLGTHYHAYLLKCHELPFYGCAFFHGEVDKPGQGFLHRGGRKPVAVAISLEGVHVIDSREKHVLLGLRFQELSWDHTSPEEEEPVLWLEFDGDSEGMPVNKLLKIYSKQAELMSGLIEYCIELNQAAEPAAPQESVPGPPAAPTSSPPPAQRPKLRRQGSVVCSRIQHLSTIDYVEDGKGIKRVKPKRTTSFFSRQLSMGQGSYTVVQPTDSLEQG
uniref:FERM domain containing 8 n=1 Tax=Microcebus murinus TaxID=30608 RepID=A0A8C5UUZ6_MICMU